MRSKIHAPILCCLLTLVIVLHLAPIQAQSYDNTADTVQSLIDGIVAYKLQTSGTDSVQTWINGEITAGAGVTSDWYAITLSQSGDYDLSAYCNALEEFVAESEISSASSREKAALALCASGSTDSYIEQCLDGAIGQQGIMSWIYGLHLLNNGYTCSYSPDAVTDTLLSLQLTDGGWALSGEHGDVDVTAMTLQALAPYCPERSDVQDAADRGIAFLSDKQQEDGGYKSFGTANPESAAQVLTALSALGIDCIQDERFIKNGMTVIDGIVRYRLSDGSFCHTDGDSSSDTSTVQVYYAFTAYLRLLNGQTPFYTFDHKQPITAESAPMSDSTGTAAADSDAVPAQQVGYRPIAVMIILGAGMTACLILFLLKKRSPYNFIFTAILTGAGAAAVLLTDIRSASDYYSRAAVYKEHAVGTVTLEIRCDTLVGKSDSSYIPEDGVILPVTSFEIEEGDTVFDILVEAAQTYGIQLDHSGNDADAAYIHGISYLYEQDFGELSGWVYHVNGISASRGCGSYDLSDGDRIEWLYTCDLGNDLHEVYEE